MRGKKEEDLDIEISVCFSELPEKIIIDSTVETSLQDEFMLNADGQLEVIKRYKNIKHILNMLGSGQAGEKRYA